LSEHLTKTQIEDYGRYRLSATELFSVSHHLGVCEECSYEVERVLRGDTAFFRLKSEAFGEMPFTSGGRAHLTPEEIAGYIDDLLVGEVLQIVKDHLTGCDLCGIAAKDLRAFKARVAKDLNREYRPSTAAVEKWWHRIFTPSISVFSRPGAPVFTSTMAIVLLILGGWLILKSLEGRDPGLVETPLLDSKATLTAVVSPTPERGDEPAMIVVRLNDGKGKVTLDRIGNLSGIDNLSPGYLKMVKGALTDPKLEKSPLLSGLSRMGEMQIRGSQRRERDFSIIKPVGSVILSDRPTFRWSRLDGAVSYIVEVYDDQLIPVINSPQLIDNSWTAPKSLARGEIYFWVVKAMKDGKEFISPQPPAPEAKFRILDRARADELKRSQRIYSGSHLTMGVIYARDGLLDEAEVEFIKLREANPESAIVRQLLERVLSMRD
jgi:hypothetical protein